jgi:hypothetical protein
MVLTFRYFAANRRWILPIMLNADETFRDSNVGDEVTGGPAVTDVVSFYHDLFELYEMPSWQLTRLLRHG